MISRRAQVIAAVGLGAIVVGVGLLAYGLDAGAQVRRCVAFFRDAGPWPFFLAMTVLPAVGFPQSAFNVVAGPVFGPTMGVGGVIACATLALAVNLAGCYWVAARAMRPAMERLVRRLGYAVPTLPDRTAWEFTLLVRIIPGPPVFLQSFLLALARVPFGTYMLVSMLVQGTFLSATILAGDAFMRGDWRALLFAGALFVMVGFVMHRLRKRFAAAHAA